MHPFSKVAGMVIVSALLPLVGCAAPVSEESLENAEQAVREQYSAEAEFSSGWPGGKEYDWRPKIPGGGLIDPGSISVDTLAQIGNGYDRLDWQLEQNGKALLIRVIMREGDMFEPGKHHVTLQAHWATQ